MGKLYSARIKYKCDVQTSRNSLVQQSIYFVSKFFTPFSRKLFKFLFLRLKQNLLQKKRTFGFGTRFWLVYRWGSSELQVPFCPGRSDTSVSRSWFPGSWAGGRWMRSEPCGASCCSASSLFPPKNRFHRVCLQRNPQNIYWKLRRILNQPIYLKFCFLNIFGKVLRYYILWTNSLGTLEEKANRPKVTECSPKPINYFAVFKLKKALALVQSKM